MSLRVHRPGTALAEHVACFWSWQGRLEARQRERLLPTGTVELVINLHEDREQVFDEGGARELNFRGALVCGPHSRYFVIDNAGTMDELGVHFRPGGARALLGLPLDALHNGHVGLDELWGSGAAVLRQRLLDAPTAADRFLVLEQALLRRLTQARARHPAVAHALQAFARAPQLPTVAEVTAATGYSAKRFIQLFRHEVGLTPKAYCRVQRFQAALRRIAGGGAVEWAQVAADCGYYDQSHFIREFREFSGLVPTDYGVRDPERMNHVPLAPGPAASL